MEAIFALMIPLTWVGFLVAERLWPARQYPDVKRWTLKGLGYFVMGGLINGALPALWAGFVERHHLADLRGAGTLLGGLAVWVTGAALAAVWHRIQHRSDFLFRYVHGLHHASERLDVPSALVFHPMDTVMNAVTTSLVVGLIFRVSPEAAALGGAIGFFNAVFQHSNIRTPRWVGYFIQRPEAHAVHHERGVHAFNYSDIPLFDMAFGTFRNPEVWQGKVGFIDGGSARTLDLLRGRDLQAEAQPVTAPRPMVTGRDRGGAAPYARASSAASSG